MAEPRREPQTEEEARELERYLKQGAATSLEVVSTFRAIDLPDLVVQPVTFPFDVTGEELLRNLTADEDQLLLDIEIADVSRSDEPPVLVFVNRPSAGAATPATDPGFVGVLAFFLPHDVVRFRLNATSAVRAAAAVPIPLTVTLVPVALAERQGAGASRVARAELQLVRSVVELPS